MKVCLLLATALAAMAAVTVPVAPVGSAPPLPVGPPQTSSYWLSTLGPKGKSPLAPAGYQVFRNVKDYGARGDGVTDDTAAINRAAAAMSPTNAATRCAADCGSTTTLGAVVYFPPGTYVVSSPVIQYYHTQFVGDAVAKPTLKGAANFSGIALVDGDFYVPGGNGSQWYINQSNFYRQIRNLVFDLTGMARQNFQGDQQYVPTGIHWQVGQATSITNCDFRMAVSDTAGAATAMGIMMENGSGGTVSDLTFVGGNIGFFAGSQQFTATNLQFTSCLTAIKQVWNWGFTWKNLYVVSCYVAIDCTQYSTATRQGTGSISVVDSHFNGVPYAITVAQQGSQQPSIVLENLLVENSASVVLVSGGSTLLAGSTTGPLYIASWASGLQYLAGGSAGKKSGYVSAAPKKPAALLDASGRYFWRSKPQYETVAASSILLATDFGVANDGTGDQTQTINGLLSLGSGKVIFFPAGIYMVQGTINIPVGCKIVGSGWSQIMATGSFFGDEANPKPVVKVGKPGDKGVIEISDMLFTVKGSTAGAVLMEWNVHESTQGSAAMWDSHFRVGGAAGTNLQLADCPIGGTTPKAACKAASLLLRVTGSASAYLDNVWAWTADHDLDSPLNGKATEGPDGIPSNVLTDISVYTGRGVLIESQGPTWLYGTSSEHHQLYQYQLSGAKNVYMGHMQTETPYYQPAPNAAAPYTIGRFPTDPTFGDCAGAASADGSCRGAWALRLINSSSVFIYSAGFYSFFQNYQLGCTATESCQKALVETSYTTGLWLFNLFTKGNTQIVTPRGGTSRGLLPVLFNDTTANGYTSEVAAWLPLALGGGDMGLGNGTAGAGSGDVYVDPGLWGSAKPTVSCAPPCTYVLPPATLKTPTTIKFPPSTTALEVGWTTTAVYTDGGSTSTTSIYTKVTVTTVLTIPPLTTNKIDFSNVPIPDGFTATVITPQPSVVPPPFVVTDSPDPESNGAKHPPNSRTITPKPWPWSVSGGPTVTSSSSSSSTTPLVIVVTPVSHTTGPPNPVCTGGCGHKCEHFCSWPCAVGCNSDGKDCTGDSCTQGGDCSGPDCTRGGDCSGPKCTRGGDCTGPKCKSGGSCSGSGCGRGGSCFGLGCSKGGGCTGPLDDDGVDDDIDSNDPDKPSESDPDKCTTSTFSSCREYCTALPTTTSCTSTCDNVVGCDTTGTEIATTITPAPAAIAGLTENWQGDGDANLDSVASSVISFLSGIGDFGSASPSPTPTGIPNIPAPQPSDAAEYDTYMYVGANVYSGASPAKYGHWVMYGKWDGSKKGYAQFSTKTCEQRGDLSATPLKSHFYDGQQTFAKVVSNTNCVLTSSTSGVAGLMCDEFFNPIEAAIEFEEPLEENLVDYASCAGVGVSWANLFVWNFKASNKND
ncbi:putative glucan 1,3-beta-glucosidase precursor [Lasiosphaeria ovina]|uniref:Glucan 1,3-beta-glucosidase n=1 Tax=Lasiosphaeria ovina TaxID=92902 RepID=A0AAE0K3Q1_9PEZI|nr:putative glucan 1,3-beta-glucosidase precursor [Lasiosphaeria ovina]